MRSSQARLARAPETAPHTSRRCAAKEPGSKTPHRMSARIGRLAPDSPRPAHRNLSHGHRGVTFSGLTNLFPDSCWPTVLWLTYSTIAHNCPFDNHQKECISPVSGCDLTKCQYPLTTLERLHRRRWGPAEGDRTRAEYRVNETTEYRSGIDPAWCPKRMQRGFGGPGQLDLPHGRSFDLDFPREALFRIPAAKASDSCRPPRSPRCFPGPRRL